MRLQKKEAINPCFELGKGLNLILVGHYDVQGKHQMMLIGGQRGKEKELFKRVK